MNGTLTAQPVDGQWVETVVGTATLKQVWAGGEKAEEVTTNNIE